MYFLYRCSLADQESMTLTRIEPKQYLYHHANAHSTSRVATGHNELILSAIVLNHDSAHAYGARAEQTVSLLPFEKWLVCLRVNDRQPKNLGHREREACLSHKLQLSTPAAPLSLPLVFRKLTIRSTLAKLLLGIRCPNASDEHRPPKRTFFEVHQGRAALTHVTGELGRICLVIPSLFL